MKSLFFTLISNNFILIVYRWGEFILTKVIKTSDFTSIDLVNQNLGEIHKQIATQTRGKYQPKKNSLHIQYVDMFPKIELQPIIFEQVYSKEAKDRFEENMVKISNIKILIIYFFKYSFSID